MRKPDFSNLLKVLRRQVPDRPTLFELFLNDELYKFLAGDDIVNRKDELAWQRIVIHGFKNAGYDYATLHGSDFHFPKGERHRIKSLSLNEGALITDWESFEEYPWPDPEACDYSCYEDLAKELPEGMKIVTMGPGGVLENVIDLVGYDNLCCMIYDDPELVKCIFDAVGSRFVKYYEICSQLDVVGAVISNDDWGFKNQTMLSPAHMRQYVFPWHKKIVEAIHKAGKPAILHSCGNLNEVMDDIIYDMKYDAKHSYEDAIVPVEEAYERWGKDIAILGGIDVDFVCRASPEEITKRSLAMLERTAERGGYALGTGNSVPYYVPRENYFAMLKAAELYNR